LNTAPYVDIHTHHRNSLQGVVSVASLSVEEITLQGFEGRASAGIHPWWPEDYTSEEIDKLKAHITQMAGARKLWAIGETGIDRSFPEQLAFQNEIFLWHLQLSEKLQLPLVIHNVRSGSDFLGILKKERPTNPWVFHDFRGNEDLVKKLLDLHTDCYFSFGISLDNSPQVRELMPSIPLERLFFETDNQKHLDIHDIYLRAAEQLGLDLDYLKSQIWMNFQRLGN
jgi:TatD DNase family protein